jgi:hypothetical protein
LQRGELFGESDVMKRYSDTANIIMNSILLDEKLDCHVSCEQSAEATADMRVNEFIGE